MKNRRNLSAIDQAIRSIIIEALGGVCVKCGSSDCLEIDHVDPRTKLFTVSCGYRYSPDRLWAEVAKCQLLCKKCHTEKSALDFGKRPVSGRHRTESTYKKCHCQECKDAHAAYMKRYRSPISSSAERPAYIREAVGAAPTSGTTL